ncbi:hypothetical protein [Anditalea andensis]|uniref:Uncharacterized protein n=1 Tax=Anditalea andensis TaxID=1048983 RepID=A0A074KZK3_9BACT|nr:hypothetical protein [Anditalea andensis]KEO73605.1 hypothetical protein EL17_11950 [Anditalea andensis]
MAKKNKKPKSNSSDKEQLADELDFTSGFGGFPSDVEFTRNIGCASNSKKKDYQNIYLILNL